MDKPLPSNPELELAICQEPGNNENWLVYSDWLQTQGHPQGEVIAMELAIKNAENQAEMEARLRPRIPETYPDWGEGFFSESDDEGRVNTIQIQKKDESEISMVWSKGCVERIILDFNIHEPLDTLLEQFETILNSIYSRLLAGLWITIWLVPSGKTYQESEDERYPDPLKSLDVIFAEILAILTKTGAGTYLVQLLLSTEGGIAPMRDLDIAPLVSSFPNLRKLGTASSFDSSGAPGPGFRLKGYFGTFAFALSAALKETCIVR